MTRVIRYTFNGATQPADPTESSTVYTAPLVYQAGYYKAKAWDEGVASSVTSKSFERSPTDYVAYYPFTVSFNDYVGSNNAYCDSGSVSITSNGVLFDSTNDRLSLTDGIFDENITIAFTYTSPSIVIDDMVLLNEDSRNYILFWTSQDRYFGYWNLIHYPSSLQMEANTTYKIVITKSGTLVNIYANGSHILVDSNHGSLNSLYPFKYIGNFKDATNGGVGLYKELKVFNRALTANEAILLTTE